MRFKMIVAFVDETSTDAVLDAAREAGATGATVINHARGEGVVKQKTFMGIGLDIQRDVVLWLVEEHMSRHILETICQVGQFDTNPGQGIAIQIDVEDAVGVAHQVELLSKEIEDQI